MATVFLRGYFDHAAVVEAVGAHNGQSCVGTWRQTREWDNDYDPSKRHNEIHEFGSEIDRFVEETFPDVRVIKVGRVTDIADPRYNRLTAWIDTEHESAARIKDWLAEHPWVQWHIAADGELVFPLVTAPVEEQDKEHALGETCTHVGWGNRTKWPSLTIYIDEKTDGPVPCDILNLEGDIAYEGHLGDAQLVVTRTSGVRYSKGAGFGALILSAIPMAEYAEEIGDRSAWRYMDEYHYLHGYNVEDDEVAKRAGLGRLNYAMRAAGIPANAAVREAIVAAGCTEQVREPGRRMLDLSDVMDPVRGPPKGAVMDFPFCVRLARLQKARRDEEVAGYSSRRSTRIRYQGVDTSTRPIVLGLTKNRKGYKLFDPTETYAKFRKLGGGAWQDNNDHFWSIPQDRFLVVRSPLGWHGLFCLNIEIEAKERTPVAHFSYMVPVFMSHDETKHHFGRYRNFPASLISALRGTHGIEDFLRQALFALEGAKAKATKGGFDLDGVTPLDAVLRVPQGHMLRTWGGWAKAEGYAVTVADGYSRTNKPAKHRAMLDAATILSWCDGREQVQFTWEATYAEPANSNEEAEPVVVPSRRVLDI